jgi:4-amino-4-deoxy-L-arabinose transferase-like glycosyltransferase
MTRDILAAVLVGIAAVLPRIGIVASYPAAGLIADMLDYFDRARHLFEHGRLYPDAFRVPAYPVAIAGSFATFGEGLLAPRILQCAILTLLAMATYALARRSMDRRWAVMAGLIVAWYPGLLLYTLYVMAEPLFTLFVVLAVLCVSYGRHSIAMLGAGVCAGLATLTRQAGVAVAAALVLWPVLQPAPAAIGSASRRRRLLWASTVLAGVLVAMAPWAVRNYRVFGRWMPLETTSGITFLMAYYEDATGRYLMSDWETVHRRYLSASPEEFSRNTLAYRLGLERIVSDPVRIMKLVPFRIGYLFDLEGREHLWLYRSSYFGPYPTWAIRAAGWAIAAAFPLLMLSALVSLTFGPTPRGHVEWLVVWVLAVMIVQLLTIYGDPRFHLPLVPLLAFVAVRPWSSERVERSWWRIGVGIVVIALALLWWGMRLPQQMQAIDQAASPNGWQSHLPY